MIRAAEDAIAQALNRAGIVTEPGQDPGAASRLLNELVEQVTGEHESYLKPVLALLTRLHSGPRIAVTAPVIVRCPGEPECVEGPGHFHLDDGAVIK
jgi:hypothetical protein